MAIFFWIAFPALGVCVVAALYPELFSKPFAGNGKRRFTKASAAALTEEIGVLSLQLAEAKRPKPCPNCHHVPGGVMPTDAEVAASDASETVAPIHLAAPVDAGYRDRPEVFAATARDDTLAAMARPGEEEMLAVLEAERANTRAKANAVTAVIPCIPDRAPEANPLNIPAPSPLASATAIPVGMPDRAHLKVTAALNEAS